MIANAQKCGGVQKKNNLTQAQLCKIVKISPRKLVEIEKGNYDKITFGLAKKIAEALGTSVKELVTAAQPMSTGMQPAAPPQTMFCEVFGLSAIV